MEDDSWPTVLLRFLRVNLLLRLTRFCLWLAVGWALAGPFEVAAKDGAFLVLVALSGAAVGAVGSLACAFGATSAFLWHGAEPLVLLWWLVPFVVVYAIVQLRLSTVVSDERTDMVFFAISGLALFRHRRSSLVARLTLILGYAVLAVPLWVLWEHKVTGGAWTAAALAAIQHVWFFRATGRLSRYRRTEARVSSVSWVVFCALLALSPVGRGFVQLWRERVPGTAAGVAIYLVLAIALAAALNGYLRLSERSYLSLRAAPQLRHRMAFVAVYGFLFLPVWFCTLSVAVHASASALSGTFALAVGAQVLFASAWLSGPSERLHRLDASLFMRYEEEGQRDTARQVWLAEVTRGPRGRPNFTLVRVLADSAVRICLGTFIPPPPRQWETLESGLAPRVELAVHWIDEATTLLNMIKLPSGGADFRTEYYAHRIQCLLALNCAYTLHGYPEDARRALLEAVEMCRRADMPNLRAMFTRDAWAAGQDFDPVDPAEVETVMSDQRIDPLVRARIMIDVKSLLCAQGRRERAVRFLANVAGTPYLPDGTGNDRIVRVVGPLRATQVRVVTKGLDMTIPSLPADLSVLELGGKAVDDIESPLGHRELLAAVLMGRLRVRGARGIKAGMTLLARGAAGRGVGLLLSAADRLLRRGLDAVALEVLEQGGTAVKQFDAQMALACLEPASRIRDRHREYLMDAKHRLAYAATTEPLYEDVIGLLVATAQPSELIQAFDLVEKARSRDLVDLLGQTVPRPADDGVPEVTVRLLRAEKAAQRVVESRARLGDAYREAVGRDRWPTPHRDDPEETAGWMWAKDLDAAMSARRHALLELQRLRDSSAEPRAIYLAWLFAQEALAEHRLRVEARRMRTARDKTGPLRGRRQAKDQQEQIWHQLAQQGGRAAEYVALRSGAPVTFDEVRALLAQSSSATP
ncbi:hypothetical protein AB0C28_41795 [Nonomuraea sp. NPDC048892]|uniref:hypothetical protein n=1 Tax=Nonomuraea sp. NPDC048892 TaxID=3154624 RepID=UPI0033E62E89